MADPTLVLASAATAQHTALFVELVRSGGPVAAALVLVVILVMLAWKVVGKPSMDALVSISANFAKATQDLERITSRAEHAVSKAETLVAQMEDRR